MLSKPDIPDALILSRLAEEYGLSGAQLKFLPLGADLNTSVYRVDTPGGQAFFLKLRSGVFDEVPVAVPQFLQQQGALGIIAPLATRTGGLWADFDIYKLILYPFVAGKDGYEVALSEAQWVQFGSAMQAIHAARVPPDLAARIPGETFSSRWRDVVKALQAEVEQHSFEEPVADRLAAFMRSQKGEISRLVERAGRLAQWLQANPPPKVLCHADIHPGNLLIAADGALYIVDWDTLAFAPRERDLMFAGEEGSREAELFARGYGPLQIDRVALAYYHAARILEDLAVVGEQLFRSTAGGDDREQAYGYFVSNFQPGNTIAIADRAFGRIDPEIATDPPFFYERKER
jgi:spectinomycin phosphotransferase